MQCANGKNQPQAIHIGITSEIRPQGPVPKGHPSSHLHINHLDDQHTEGKELARGTGEGGGKGGRGRKGRGSSYWHGGALGRGGQAPGTHRRTGVRPKTPTLQHQYIQGNQDCYRGQTRIIFTGHGTSRIPPRTANSFTISNIHPRLVTWFWFILSMMFTSGIVGVLERRHGPSVPLVACQVSLR